MPTFKEGPNCETPGQCADILGCCQRALAILQEHKHAKRGTKTGLEYQVGNTSCQNPQAQAALHDAVCYLESLKTDLNS